MSTIKISELPAVPTAPGSALVPIVAAGVTSRVTRDQFLSTAITTASVKMPSAGGGSVKLAPGSTADTLVIDPIEGYYVPGGTGAVPTTAQAALRRTVWVEDFGAVGNGTTDDILAFEKAVTYLTPLGGTIFCKSATYAISRTLNIGNGTSSSLSTLQAIKLVGKGSGTTDNMTIPSVVGTTLKWIGGTGGVMVQFNGPIYNVEMTGFKLECNALANTGIYWKHVSNSEFHDILVTHFRGDAFYADSYKTPFAGMVTGANATLCTQLYAFAPTTGHSASGLIVGPSGGAVVGNLDVARWTFVGCEFQWDASAGSVGNGIVLQFTDNCNFYSCYASPFGGSVGFALYVIPVPGLETSFPGALTFYSCAFIGGFGVQPTVPAWNPTNKIIFLPLVISDDLSIPSDASMMGVTSTGVAFNGFAGGGGGGGGSVTGGAANQIVYQSAPSTSAFIAAPAGTTGTYGGMLYWTGTGFVWSNQVSAKTYTTQSGSGAENAYFGEDAGYGILGFNTGLVMAVGGTFPGTGKLVLDSGTFRPFNDLGMSLGTGLKQWSTVYAQNLTLSGTITSAIWGGSAIPVAKGGTNLTATPANGQIPIGNGSGYALATITAGTNITVTNGAGTITIAATGGGGGSGTVNSGTAGQFAYYAGTGTAVSGYASGTTGSGAVVLASSPALTTPNLGTPSAGTLTNCTGYTAANISGTIPISKGGTNSTATPTAGAICYGNGSSYVFTTGGSGYGQLLIYNPLIPGPQWSSAVSAVTYTTLASTGSATSNGYLGEGSGYVTLGGVNGIVFAVGGSFPGTGAAVIDSGTVRPFTDNVMSLGTGAKRYTTVYAVTGTINTSDAAEKQQVRELEAAEKLVAQRIKKLIRAYKWNADVASKGEAARIHIGAIAQDVHAAFAAEGLDAAHYGMFCSDTWINEDGVEVTRKGLRYEELFAFVISVL